MKSSRDDSFPKNGTALLRRSMRSKEAAKAANQERAARVDFDQEGFGRHRREEELEEARVPGMVEAKVREISSALTVANSAIIRVTAPISRSVTTAEVEATSPQIAPTLRKATPTLPHPKTGRGKEKGSMELPRVRITINPESSGHVEYRS